MGEQMRERKLSLMNSVNRFWSEDKGSITIQVLMFSLLLLATTGIVLDSGRLYSQHSQLQVYADQVSLAAANELDGTSDSIIRAGNAVYGTDTSGDQFLQKAGLELGKFEVTAVYFYDSMNPSTKTLNNMEEAFPKSAQVATMLSGETEPRYANSYDDVTGPRAARYAVVQVVEASTNSSLFRILPREGSETQFSFGAVAAATMEKAYCADLSTIVFCNPWEDTVPEGTVNAYDAHPFDLEPDDPDYSLVGRSLIYFAPNFTDDTGGETPLDGVPVENGRDEYGSAFEWDTPHQLFQLTEPIIDAGGICDQANVPLISGEEYEVARARCLMARAERDQVCWGENGQDLVISPAHGPDVVRAVNTAFDIWLEPFLSYIQQPDSPLNTAGGVPTGLSAHQFFEPDALAVTMFEPADWYDVDPVTGDPLYGTKQDGSATAELAERLNVFDAIDAHVTPAPDMRYMGRGFVSTYKKDICHSNTYVYRVVGVTTAGFPEGACDEDFIGEHYSGNTSTVSQQRGDMENYWLDFYTVPVSLSNSIGNNGLIQWPPGVGPNLPWVQFCGTPVESLVTGLEEACDARNLAETLPDGDAVDTWYEVYKMERAALANPNVLARSERSLVTANVDAAGITEFELDGNGDPELDANGNPVPITPTGGLWGDGNVDTDDDGVDDTYVVEVDYMSHFGLADPSDDFVKHTPKMYFGLSPAVEGERTGVGLNPGEGLYLPQRERRRIRSAMVNCKATIAGGDGSSNEYTVAFDDVRVLDMYLPQPASYHCGFGPDIDGDGDDDPLPSCAVEESKDTLLYAEIIEDVTEEATTQQFIAKLVR